MLSNLRVVLFFVYSIVESFEKVFMRHLTMGYVIIYCTNINPNVLDKIANYIEFRVVKG